MLVDYGIGHRAAQEAGMKVVLSALCASGPPVQTARGTHMRQWLLDGSLKQTGHQWGGIWGQGAGWAGESSGIEGGFQRHWCTLISYPIPCSHKTARGLLRFSNSSAMQLEVLTQEKVLLSSPSLDFNLLPACSTCSCSGAMCYGLLGDRIGLKISENKP